MRFEFRYILRYIYVAWVTCDIMHMMLQTAIHE
jgi:hypothetical protein